ncbi:hypothetical protein RUND412_006955 [Rhizina undulata]
MRSSIACVRCRRSKVKCVNTGPNTTCRACEGSNRECTYPNPAPQGTPRSVSTVNPVSGGVIASGGSLTGGERGIGGTNGVGAGERTEVRTAGAEMADEAKARAPVLTSPKQAPKKVKVKKPQPAGGAGVGAVSHTGPKAYREALDATIFTPTLWIQIFETFQLHYMPTLPFLHPPTFRERLRTISNLGSGATSSSSATPPAPDDGYSQLLLLGLLALTARHIPALVSYHSPGLASPAAVSDFYASALKYRLQNEETSITEASLEKVQAILMLAVHEWGSCRGSQAYVWLGLAIRMGGLLGLSLEDDDDEGAWPHQYVASTGSETGAGRGREEGNSKRRKIEQPRAASSSDKSSGAKENTDKEIKRRTFWGLFMLDRKLSAGKYRPSAISYEEAKRVKLPCGETAFLFGDREKAGYLGDEEGRKNERNGDGDRADAHGGSILAKVVRITEIWGRVQQWACNGGRRTENYPPWNPQSNFHKLFRALEDFHAALPQNFHFSPQNLNAHFSSRTAGAYSVMHITYFLCLVILHREYIPFIPLRTSKPLGPIDVPMLENGLVNLEGLEEGVSVAEWWDESAKEMFRSVHGIMQIVSSLEDWNSLVETPEVGFAVYLVSVTGIYAWIYPWMDQAGYITGRIHPANASFDEDENMEDEKREAEGSGKDATRAIELVIRMKEKWKMADGFYHTLARLKKFFWRARNEYRIHGDEFEDEDLGMERIPAKTLNDSLHGLDEWRNIEKMFRDSNEASTPSSSAQHTNLALGRDPEVKREGDVETLMAAVKSASDSWTAVNTKQPQDSSPSAAQGANQLASLASYASAQTPMPHPGSSFSGSQSQSQTQLSPPLSASGNSPMRQGHVSMTVPRSTVDLEQVRLDEERRRTEDRRRLLKEIEAAERVVGAGDLAAFASGSSADDWATGFHDGWVGRLWGSRMD